jgi:hypothetical protein
LEDDNSSDDDKKFKKKALASIAINNKPSIFDTSSTCRMAKPTKVKMMIVMMMLVKVIIVRMKQLNKLIKMI